MLNGKVILITGGTGSFGKKCVEIILKKYKPRKLIIFSRDEQKHFAMEQEFSEKKYPCLRYFVGDIRSRARLHRAFNGVEYIIHAAAMKHVPLIEYNPYEAVRTNIIGTQNVIDVAVDRNVKKVILISTDKAVNPINLYGSTKLCAEKLTVEANVYSGKNTQFAVARYGNVIGSKGSVLHIFRKAKETGVIPVTDDRMTRFWITLEEGVEFVINSLKQMHGGEIFIPKIASMKVVDFAKAVAPKCKIKIIGKRPGEKIHEMLISDSEVSRTVDKGKYYIVYPDFPFFKEWKKQKKNIKPCADDFEYSSDKNNVWLTIEEIKKIINI